MLDFTENEINSLHALLTAGSYKPSDAEMVHEVKNRNCVLIPPKLVAVGVIGIDWWMWQGAGLMAAAAAAKVHKDHMGACHVTTKMARVSRTIGRINACMSGAPSGCFDVKAG